MALRQFYEERIESVRQHVNAGRKLKNEFLHPNAKSSNSISIPLIKDAVIKKEEKQTNLQDKVKVKVNGQEIEVPLQDVINAYSGQQEIHRRFTDFDKQKKAWEKRRGVKINNGKNGSF